MALAQDAADTIRQLVRAGFLTQRQIIEVLTEEVYSPGELDQREVEAAVADAVQQHQAEKSSWPEVTDCDRLTKAFHSLTARGVLSLENAGLDQSDGYQEFRDALAKSPESERIVGYCFYHSQDVETALQGDGLYLAFGPRHPTDEATAGAEIGRMVLDELAAAGLRATWNGNFRQRIHMPAFNWQRR